MCYREPNYRQLFSAILHLRRRVEQLEERRQNASLDCYVLLIFCDSSAGASESAPMGRRRRQHPPKFGRLLRARYRCGSAC